VKTKIFHIITKLELGGAQKVVLMTLERLPSDRYDRALVTGTEGLLVDDALQLPGVRVLWVRSLVREIRPLKDILAFISLWRLFRRERPGIVHTHSSKAGILARWAARFAGVPVVFHTIHGFSFNDFQHPVVRRTYQWLERVTAGISDQLSWFRSQTRTRVRSSAFSNATIGFFAAPGSTLRSSRNPRRKGAT
jgi:hypothetical protein